MIKERVDIWAVCLLLQKSTPFHDRTQIESKIKLSCLLATSEADAIGKFSSAMFAAGLGGFGIVAAQAMIVPRIHPDDTGYGELPEDAAIADIEKPRP
jgi:hypothetical protein